MTQKTFASSSHQHVVLPEGDGGSLDADLEVVLAVHHGVFGVVGYGPENVGQQHEPRDQRHFPGLCREAHGDAEAESDAEISLRDGEKALGEGVAGSQKQSGKGQQNGQFVEAHDEQKCADGERREQDQRFFLAHQSGGHGAVFCAFHMGVEIAVGIVVDDATGRAHQHRAEHKNPQDDPVGLSGG